MKNTVLKSALGAFLCFFSTIGFAQTKNDVLHGKVRSVIYITILEGNFKSKTIMEYDDQQLLVKESDYNQTGDVPNFVLEYKYDQFRNLTETYKNGALLETIDFSTDEKGKITRIVGLIYGKPNVSYFKYDKNGNEVEKLFQTDDKFVSKRTYIYDDKNNCIEEQLYLNGKLFSSHKYIYDSKNLMIERAYYMNDKLRQTYVFAYDPNDNEVSEKMYTGKKEKLLRTETYSYNYDAQNNWTMREKFLDGKPYLYKETREITYYP